MIKEEVRQEIKSRWEEILSQITRPAKRKVNGRTSYICPICSHGKGGDGLTINPQSTAYGLKCFGSCGFSGDIIDLIGQVEGITEYPEKVRRAGEYLGIRVDEETTGYIPPSSPLADKKAQPVDQEEAISQLSFYREAQSHLKETDYHTQRGISEATANRYMLGYIPNWKHPKKPNAPASPRLIIPVSEYTYIARDTREELTPEQENYKKQKARMTTQEKANWIFNVKALQTAQKPIVVTEGELDALSIIEVGGEAVGIGSTAYINAFVEYVKQQPPAQPLILALDNDDTGRKATADLEAKLKAIGIYPYRAELYGRCKDANELLIKDREALTRAVAQAEQEAYSHQEKTEEELAEEELKEYRKTSAKGKIQDFLNGIADSVNTPAIPTGFTALDNELDGGLFEGLYILGAISSLGKTSLVLQIADQIADCGQDVLIFSLEMAETELMAKSISRQTLIDTLANDGNIANCKTARGITAGARYERYSQEEKDLIKRAVNAYGSFAGNVYIMQGVGNIGAPHIREAVERHISITGNTPVVVVDYLQILSPYNERATDKQNTDKNVVELKRISRDHKTPVIAISSFNRENYKNAVSMQAFKESGSVEYSSDVLIGLQLKGAGEKGFDEVEAKAKTPREVELVILKNRNGKTGGKIAYKYYALFNYFEEEGKVEKPQPKKEPVYIER